MKKKYIIQLAALLIFNISFAQVGTSFSEPTGTSVSWTDSNKSTHQLSNDPSRPAVEYTFGSNGMSELGFTSKFISTRQPGSSSANAGISNDNIGVVTGSFFSSETGFTIGSGNVYTIEDPDGTIQIEFDEVDLSGTSAPVLSFKYGFRGATYEQSTSGNDRFFVGIRVNGSSSIITLLDTDGGGTLGGGNLTGNDLNDGANKVIVGSEQTFSVNLSAYIGNRVTLVIELDTDADSEDFAFDDIQFSQGSRVLPNQAPTITTSAASSITSLSANLAGNVTNDGGQSVTERGIVYALTTTNNNPEINGTGVTKVVIGTGTGVFNQTINGLANSSTYSFKAYAINSVGTSYGNVQSFTTLNIAPTISTSAASSVTGSSANLAGNVTNNGGESVTERGVVYALTATNNNPEINGTGVFKVVNGSGTGIFNQSVTGLTLNSQYSFKAYATNTVGTGYGATETFTTLANDTNTLTTNGNWSTASNWSLNRIPISTDNIQINTGSTVNLDVSASVNNININMGGTLNILSANALTLNGDLTQNGIFNILSSATNNGSLIINGTSSGNVNYLRYVTTNWHLISSPVVGQVVSGFVGQVNTSGNKYAIAPYLNNTTSLLRWNYFTDNTGLNNVNTAGNFTTAKGYTVQKSTISGTLTFSGALHLTNQPIAITDGGDDPNGNRWNLIGNPYTSSINGNNAANAMHNFLKVNIDSGSLDPSRSGLYLWNGSAPYEIKSIDDAAFYIAPGQAFFVHAPNNGGTSASFTRAMQTHQTGNIFLKSSSNYPELILKLSDSKNTATAKVRYIQNKTTGLDVGSDIGTFTGENSQFNIFTHLVKDSKGIDFAIQALPNTNYENMIVPIGINAEYGKEIQFSIHTTNLPTNLKVYLEDKKNNTFTRLDQENTFYQINLEQNEKGIGRFYLHTNHSSLNIENEVNFKNIVIHKLNASTVRISGLSNQKIDVSIYNTIGKLVHTTYFILKNLKDINLPNISKGVYIIKLEAKLGSISKKIIIE
ncbi:T9SS type A sorting domain-containing protein [Polaribacter porphyrae]|uniref:Secretion system C-terminal sorting domain-containing protein n=1 Tax=Polaribacter porphyrae TaxID=1137780 RepID=A0A2S7WR59_9FLAO|nr:T9SS type A sorting domain-containing protein [Polaribacter porphyrae]PQJ80108.1 hypothetical protein BTO18_13400 [Polaribacter porphyrae]